MYQLTDNLTQLEFASNVISVQSLLPKRFSFEFVVLLVQNPICMPWFQGDYTVLRAGPNIAKTVGQLRLPLCQLEGNINSLFFCFLLFAFSHHRDLAWFIQTFPSYGLQRWSAHGTGSRRLSQFPGISFTNVPHFFLCRQSAYCRACYSDKSHPGPSVWVNFPQLQSNTRCAEKLQANVLLHSNRKYRSSSKKFLMQ